MENGEQPLITSPHNPKIKSLVNLRKRRERDRTGLFVIEGARELSRAIQGGVRVEEIYFCPGIMGDEERRLFRELEKRKIKLNPVGRRAFEKIAYRESTGGLVALAEKPDSTLHNLPRNANPVYLVVDAVEKPGNLGAIFRSADGAGVTGVIVSAPGTDLFNPNVIRASLGTVFTVPSTIASARDGIQWLKSSGTCIVTSTPRGVTEYTDIDMASPCAIVVGSEDRGAGNEWLQASDIRVKIPMRGSADSLNVSACATILIYEALRQRMKILQEG